MGLIIEGIVTTTGPKGQLNPAPMGITFLPGEKTIAVRPYKTTHTYKNLLSTGVGVVNLSHDGSLFVYTALGDPILPTFPARKVPGHVLTGCPWWEIEVRRLVDEGDRALFICEIVEEGSAGIITGFNRAQAALVEGAILGTRHFCSDPDLLQQELKRLATIVGKTGGPREEKAWAYLLRYLHEKERKADVTDVRS